MEVRQADRQSVLPVQYLFVLKNETIGAAGAVPVCFEKRGRCFCRRIVIGTFTQLGIIWKSKIAYYLLLFKKIININRISIFVSKQ